MNDRLPSWLRQPVPSPKSGYFQERLRELKVNTVCSEAACPNSGVCFDSGQVTFLIMGRYCTRNCRFCHVATLPQNSELGLDNDEPARVAAAINALRLRYAVITSVTRDDLADGGAGFFAQTVNQVRRDCQGVPIEVLIPDFKRSFSCLDLFLESRPDVVGYNLETVPRLYPSLKPGCEFTYALSILSRIKKIDPRIIVKSSLILGMGENDSEVSAALRMLYEAGCDILTLGQYLSCGQGHWPVNRFITPEHFAEIASLAREMGFKSVLAGPLVRSSYKAEALFREFRNSGDTILNLETGARCSVLGSRNKKQSTDHSR